MAKLNPAVVVLFAAFGIMAYLIVSNQMTNEWLLALTVIIVAALWYWRKNPDNISFEEARTIAVKKALEHQERGDIDDGTIYTSGDQRMKFMQVMDEVSMPDGTKKFMPAIVQQAWEVVVIIEGTTVSGYLYRIDPKGVLMDRLKIDTPSLYSLLEREEMEIIKAVEKPKGIEPEER